jgi:hypothetical protein
MAEQLVTHTLVRRRHPLLGAPDEPEFGTAADNDVTAAGGLGLRAIARLPADVDQTRTPRVAQPALHGDDGQTRLCHDRIQTH